MGNLAYREGVDHGLEPKIDLPSADDLGDVLEEGLDAPIWPTRNHQSHTGVIGLEQGDFDAFILEEALGLGQVKRSVVWRSVPRLYSALRSLLERFEAYQFARKVILSVDMLTDQAGCWESQQQKSTVP